MIDEGSVDVVDGVDGVDAVCPWCPCRPQALHRGLTLIEVLAVIVLIGLVASAVAYRAQRGPDAALAAAESIARGFDMRARIAAPATGRVALTIDEDGSLALFDVQRESVIAKEQPPRNVVFRLLAMSEHGAFGAASNLEWNEVEFDAAGRSIDYVIEIRTGDRARRLAVAGLTGWIEEVDP